MKKNPFNLATDSRGNYTRSIGVRLVDGEFKKVVFYLGRDRGQAAINSHRLEQAWDIVHDRWYRRKDHDTPRASWDEAEFAIGKAIGLGKPEVVVSYPYTDGPVVEARLWLNDLRERFGHLIVIRTDDHMKDVMIENVIRQKAVAAAIMADDVATLRGKPTDKPDDGPKLSDALAAYGEYVKKKYRDQDGTVSPFGLLVGRRIDNMKNHLGDKLDTPLARIGNTFLEELEDFWAARPLSQKGGPVSVSWAEGVIATIRHFLKWLHRTDDFPSWSIPAKYTVRPITVKATKEEMSKPPKMRRYSRAELPTLYEYASPRERVFILLALNCGFGEGEISNLTMDELHLDGDRPQIKRFRNKTMIFGKWLLWPETVEALRWYIDKVRPESDSPNLFITDKGRPLDKRTKSGNRSQYVSNSWDRVYKRIVKDKPDWPKKSFNKLRKTGSNWIRRKYGKELADLYLGHGRKEIADAYTEKRFGPMFRATQHYRKIIQPMFDAVAVPFPEDAKKSNPSTSRGKIARLQHLRDVGYTIKKISETEKVAPQTIMRWTTKPTRAK